MAQIVEIRSKHRALMRLRGKLTWRRFRKETGRLIGFLIALIFILPFVFGMALGSWLVYTQSPEHWSFAALGIVMVGLWIGWIVIPLVAASLSDSIDLENLLIYPLTRRDLVISNLLGTVFDYQSWVVLPFFVAIVIGFGGFGRISNASSTLLLLPLVLIACLIAWGLMVTSSQLVLTALGGVLQSRRTRDVAIVLLSTSGFACWMLTQFAPRITDFFSMVQVFDGEQIASLQPLTSLQWFPTGALARSIEQAASGAWLPSLLWLGYALAWLLLLIWAWGALLDRLLTGQGFLLGSGGDAAPKVAAGQGSKWGLAWLGGRVSAETRFIAAKELKVVWRIPQRRIALLQAFLMPIFITAIPLLQSDSPFASLDLAANVAAALPLYTLFFFWVLSQNMLGWEHSGLPALLLMPVARKRIFLGKSIALLIIGLPPLILFGLALTFATGDATILFWTLLSLAMALPCLAVSAVVSARFPYPVQLDLKTNRNSFSRGGCVAALVATIPVPLSFLLLNLPLAAPILVYYFAPQYRLIALVIAVLGVGWAVFVFGKGMTFAGRILQRFEPEAIAAAQPTKND